MPATLSGVTFKYVFWAKYAKIGAKRVAVRKGTGIPDRVDRYT